MMDGVSTMDTGNNGQMLQMNVEAIAEVKVLTSGYQAEYGRSSGLQITAVTKSGTNRSAARSTTSSATPTGTRTAGSTRRTALPKTVSKERDWGYTIGGPVGKPGGNNKLFFFYSHEYRPRESGRQVNRFRVPTAAERAGDFSQIARPQRRTHPDSERSPICLHGRERAAASGGGVSDDSGRPAVSAGPGDPEALAGAEHQPAWQLQLRGRTADREHADPAAGGPARLPALVRVAR